MNLMFHFYIFVTALFSSLVMVPAIRRWAIDTGAIDFPGERRTHNRAIARAGGVAIFVPFMFSVLVYFEITREVRGILAGSLLIFFTGLIDDLYQLSPKQKFVGQISGCLVAILVGRLYLTNLGDLVGLGEIVLPVWAGGLLALFALVGVVNAVNLIDGLDGLAGGISAIALLTFLWLALQEGNMSVLALSAGMLGGLLGFLKYNAFPAKIFMGDTGSLVVGFVLGCLAIALTQGEGTSVNAVVPLIILAVPITDTLVVMFNRAMRRQNPFTPDRTHLHHKIMSLGLEHSLTVLLIYSLSLGWALLALLFRMKADYILFSGLVIGTIILHLSLNISFRYKDSLQQATGRFRDHLLSSRFSGLREKLSCAIDDLIALGLFLYAFSACFSQGESAHALFWFCSGLSGVVGLLLVALNRHQNNSLVHLLLLGPVLLINFLVEGTTDQSFMFGLSLEPLTNTLFVVLAIFLAAKFIVLKSLDNVLDFSLEFILFAMGLTLAVVSPDFDKSFHLSGVISKGIIVFLAFRIISFSSRIKLLLSAVIVNLTLLFIAAKLLMG